MPISEYFGGHGAKVKKSMEEQYGKEKGERVFYATAKKKGKEPKKKPKRGSAGEQLAAFRS
jgi:hypothetical protein